MINEQLQNMVEELESDMTVEQFRDYATAFILYKQLSARMVSHGNRLLEKYGHDFAELDRNNTRENSFLGIVRQDALERLGYWIAPSELFQVVATDTTRQGTHLLLELTEILTRKNPVLSRDLEKTFKSASSGSLQEDCNILIARVMEHLVVIDSF